KGVDQAPFARLVEERGEEAVRADVRGGGFRLREAGPGGERVLIAACGTIVPEALAAAAQLSGDEGVEATVIVLSSPDRLYRGWRDARLRPLRDGSPRPRLIWSV